MNRLVCVAIALGLLAAADDPKDLVKKELKKLEGTWHATAFAHNGKALPEENVKDWTLEIKGDKYTMTIGSNTEEGTFKIDPSKEPDTVDCTPTSGNNSGKTRKGIYKLDGDKAQVCFSAVGTAERPKEFSSPDGSDNYLWTFKREKK